MFGQILKQKIGINTIILYGNAQVNILPKNIFSVRDIRNKLEKSLTGSDKIKFLDSMTKSMKLLEKKFQFNKLLLLTELRTLKSSPEAIMCNVATQSGENHL